MIIICKGDYDIIDTRPEAEVAAMNRQYIEDRYEREHQRELKEKLRKNTHPFAQKLLSACGLL